MKRESCGGLMLLCALTAGSAIAAGFEVDGVRLGMTETELKTQLGARVECVKRAPSKSDPSEAICSDPAFAKTKKLPNSFAGLKTLIRYHLLDGRVARISFAGLPSLAFDDIVRSMEPTYGKATVESKKIQASIRAELVDQVGTWSGDHGDTIVLDKYSPGNINRANLNFYSAEYRKAAQLDPP